MNEPKQTYEEPKHLNNLIYCLINGKQDIFY